MFCRGQHKDFTKEEEMSPKVPPKKKSKKTKVVPTFSQLSKDKNEVKPIEDSSDVTEDEEEETGHQDHGTEESSTYENNADLTNDEEEIENPTRSPRPSPGTTSSSKPNSNSWILPSVIVLLGGVILAYYLWSSENSNLPSASKDWRLNVDPNHHLPSYQANVIRASLKPLLDKSATEQEEGVSTLLILSSDEENAAKLARCLLKLVNTKASHHQEPTEIDLQSHEGGKLSLDRKLKSLLQPGGAIRAVLLRHIDNDLSNDTFDQLRLLFAYCDGENPVVPHRLIIMTAASHQASENNLREKYKTRWPTEHDFVDALMSRISGHTLFIEKNQASIC